MKQEKRADKQIGGFARAKALTPERRSQIARDAVVKRWANRIDEKKGAASPLQENAEVLKQNTSGSGAHLPI